MVVGAMVWLAVGAGVTAGITFVFSNFAMRSLAEIPHPGGLLAMQDLNRRVLNPAFLFFFIGTSVPAATVIILSFNDDVPAATVIAGVVYLLGITVVTAARNVPLNNALDEVAASDPDSLSRWQAYNRSWTAWNHLRAVASLAACVLATLGLIA